jgi:hypothetical protein
MAGFWAGGPLVDPTRPLTTRQAITRGVMVALLAYLLAFAVLGVWFVGGAMLTGFRELTSGQNTDVARLVYELLISLLYLEILWWTSGLLGGLMLVGWLVAPLGGLAAQSLLSAAPPVCIWTTGGRGGLNGGERSGVCSFTRQASLVRCHSSGVTRQASLVTRGVGQERLTRRC